VAQKGREGEVGKNGRSYVVAIGGDALYEFGASADHL